ncbi:phage N-6-adenine-methyltransferase [Dysgonomonas sp. PFB1-18]|uniref:DNA N-6-adenine-methyltransferase n=1 Tax=unclassified Dysgonomonas TaxID=2630389 RepID=UPI0013D7642F|nr:MULTISPECIES: DNA N-6-adenine-methyltransferase [unclassified Dysgonomonas]MDH6310002.1 phage N-6-adenine-methyltransferase [Dysgonomonas sp. PF1-14]MDH6339911.1 phage N-6-adenine-methyltransferase [Dysgonomonas sp. PF1-16]MDH6381559.1 phage N-6-adenine-methyltransferase [Dysgonomonas sp. PFB1-18]MDH6398804.1 phage N-6-adenine-methyltransferase [Dysgonomonas sp. PF1-23]NDV93648.1 adenine methyltransferase [Dysgonomonas sp. 521]
MKENDEWYTPKEIIESLGVFDLDPATSIEAYNQNQSAKKIFTAKGNGLKQEWKGRIWLNPPYSNPLIQQFLTKMAEHNNGIALVFAKIEAKWFHDIVLTHATAIKFLYNRIRFYKPDGTQGMQPRNGSMLVAYGRNNAEILMNNKIKGKFLFL